MPETSAAEMPQVTVQRPDRATFKYTVEHRSGGRGGDPDAFFIDERKYAEAVREVEVDSLQQIGADLSYPDGSIDPGIRTSVRDEITRLMTLTGNIGNLASVSEDQILEVNKDWRAVNYAATYDPVTKQMSLKNTLGNADGTGDLVHQEVQIVPNKGENSITLSLMQQRGETAGHIVMLVDYSDKEYSQTRIKYQSGEFEGMGFSDATDTIVSAANQAAYKFEVQARKLESSLNKIVPAT